MKTMFKNRLVSENACLVIFFFAFRTVSHMCLEAFSYRTMVIGLPVSQCFANLLNIKYIAPLPS